MLHPERKRQRLEGHLCNNDEAAVDNDFQASIESLSGDVLANIFAFLPPQEIMYARLNNKMREAAKITIIPLTDFVVDSKKRYNSMSVMARALPNLQKIALGHLGSENKYVDGEEDPSYYLANETANHTAHDIEIISNFTKLRELKISISWFGGQLNGRYPCFFNFPLLQKLTIFESDFKWDLGMLVGLPSLKELICKDNLNLTGDLNSLRVLKDTLEKLTIRRNCLVEGNLMDLADFPNLKELDFNGTAVRGGISDIGEKDFLSLTVLALPKGEYMEQVFQRISDAQATSDQEFQRISDAEDVARIPYLFQKQRPKITLRKWYAKLSEDSPDMYNPRFTPIVIRLVRAGTRVGYRWENALNHPCEVNWLDPEPDRESSDYGTYMEELQEIDGQVDYFKGFHQPPTQEDFERILERILDEYDPGFSYDTEED